MFLTVAKRRGTHTIGEGGGPGEVPGERGGGGRRASYRVQILRSLGEEQVRQAQQAQDGLVGVTSCPGA